MDFITIGGTKIIPFLFFDLLFYLAEEERMVIYWHSIGILLAFYWHSIGIMGYIEADTES